MAMREAKIGGSDLRGSFSVNSGSLAKYISKDKHWKVVHP